MFVEIELKLCIQPADANLLYDHPLLLEHTQQEPESQYLISTYYDTPALSLHRNGLCLRIRQSGQRYYITVKSAGEMIADLQHRHEWEAEINGAEPDFSVLEADIQARVAQIIGAQTLQVVFKTEFQRTSWQLTFAEGSQVELALDFGKVGTLTQSEQISELELEFKSGDCAKLHEVADVLSKSIPLTVENRSKAERGYQLYNQSLT